MRSLSLLPKPVESKPFRRRLQQGERPPAAYVAGLLAVGVAMVLLPLSYLAVAGVILWLMRVHVVGHIGWLVGPESGVLSGAGYIVSALILALLSIFFFRPFFGHHRRSKSDHCLRPRDEPRLHAFVQQICTALGAPSPMSIQVSMDVNASARLAPGWFHFWGGGLELVLGLPLVRGLELGQFAAVLAHELGHFRQGAAMRMVHSIRSINHWFSRAAAREDAWERELAARSNRMDPFLYGLCAAVRACAWTARQVLKTHVRAGQSVSCVLLRQMELEADGAAVRLVGGEAFVGMVLEAKVIEAAWGLANRSLGMALREGRLADDLPALVAAHTRVFIPEVRRKMERTLLAERTDLFDTHPSLAERVRRARRSPARGMFRSSGPSHTLFSDFGGLCRRATAAFYQRDLGDDFNPSRMMSTSDLVTGQSDVQVGEAAVSGYFLGLLTNLRPLWLTAGDLDGHGEGPARSTGPAEDMADADSGRLRGRLIAARARIEAGYPDAVEAYRSYAASDARMLDAVQALTLMRANFWIEPGDFQLRRGGAAQAVKAFQESEVDQRELSAELAEFEKSMRLRLASALSLVSAPGVRENLPDYRSCFQEVTRLLPVLAAIGAAQPRLESLRRSFHGMGILIENLEGNETAPEVDTQLKTHALAIRLDLEAVQGCFCGLDYPFGAVSACSSLAEYALDPLPSEQDYGAHYMVAEEALGRCYALYFRIFGRLALTAGRVEGVLGLGPLQVER